MSRPPRACPSPACPLSVEDCTDPAHKPPGGWDARRGSRHERGYGTDWTRTRKKILARDRRRCVICGNPGTEVDHLIPRSRGGSDDPSNLRTLCPPCHRAKTASEAADGRSKASKASRGGRDPLLAAPGPMGADAPGLDGNRDLIPGIEVPE